MLSAGSAADTVHLHGTHREQSPAGGKASTFSINGGAGDDVVNVGQPVSGGFTLAGFAIDIDAPEPDSIKGIPVLFNGQAGHDAIHFLDSASTVATDLAFAQRQFAELFPASPPTDPPTASPAYVSRFQRVFGEDPQSTPYATIVLAQSGSLAPLNVSARAAEEVEVTLGSGNDVIQLVSGQYAYDVTVQAGAGDDTFNVENGVDTQGHRFTLHGDAGDDLVFVDFYASLTDRGDLKSMLLKATSADATVVAGFSALAAADYYVETRQSNGQWQFRLVDADGDAVPVLMLDGSAMTTAWQSINPDALPGDKWLFDTGRGLALSFSTNAETYRAGSLAADTAAQVFVGVPTSSVSLSFDGGSHVDGDMFRLAGDGVASGGEYRPSSSAPGAGSLAVAGNQFDFMGVEPLVVHGLRDFEVLTPHSAAELEIDSVRVADLNLDHLVLHVVTVDGVISWTQADELRIQEASEPNQLGGVMAISGNTLAVGAQLRGANYGVVYIYEWMSDHWVEQAKLAPADRGIGGQGFGAALALDGNRLLVGAPEDNGGTGAAYVFEREGTTWRQRAKLRSNDRGSAANFGRSVALDDNVAVIGAPGDNVFNPSYDTAFVFVLNGNVWTQAQALTAGSAGANTDFGRAVALAGDRLAVGMPQADMFGTDTGGVMVFELSGGVWNQQTVLGPSNPDPGEAFGTTLAMTSSRIVAGAPSWDGVAGDRAQQGRVFVFDRDGNQWARTARLTADGGLPEVDSTVQGKAGDQFGAAVALDGSFVVVGAPGFDGGDLDVGAAYVFYEFADTGVGHGTTWMRSTGPQGSGRLQAARPAGSDPDAPLADRFGASVAVSGNRVVAGIPGYNDTNALNQIIRADVGAFRGFTTDNLVPEPAKENVRAETIVNDVDGFGTKTLYDPASRMLLVAAPGANSIYVYINEGLYWRPVQTLTGDTSFGWDMDLSGTLLAVGAPSANKAYVFGRSGETWQLTSTVNGSAYGDGRFGSSVAIEGNRLVVGADAARLKYYSVQQADPNYRLDLGAPGVVHAFSLVNGAWQRDRILMPGGGMPEVTSTNEVRSGVTYQGQSLGVGFHTVRPGISNQITLGPKTMALVLDFDLERPAQTNTDIPATLSAQFLRNDATTPRTFTLSRQNSSDTFEHIMVGTVIEPSQNAGNLANLRHDDPNRILASFGLGEHFRPQNNSWEDEQYFQVTSPNVQALVLDCCGGEGDAWFMYSGYYNAQGGVVATGTYAGYEGGNNDPSGYPGTLPSFNMGAGIQRFPVIFGEQERDEIDRFVVMSTLPYTELDRKLYPFLDNGRWGAELEIVGNQVFVGGPGTGGFSTVYDLNQATHAGWRAQVVSATGQVVYEEAPLRPSAALFGGGGSDFGSAIDAVDANWVLIGSPGEYIEPSWTLEHDRAQASGIVHLASGDTLTLTAKEVGGLTGTAGNGIDLRLIDEPDTSTSASYDSFARIITVRADFATTNSTALAQAIHSQLGSLFEAASTGTRLLSLGDDVTRSVRPSGSFNLPSGDSIRLHAVTDGDFDVDLELIDDPQEGVSYGGFPLGLRVRLDLGSSTTADIVRLINGDAFISQMFRAESSGNSGFSAGGAGMYSVPMTERVFQLESGDEVQVTHGSFTGGFELTLIDAAGGPEGAVLSNPLVDFRVTVTVDFATGNGVRIAELIDALEHASATSTGVQALEPGDDRLRSDVLSNGRDATSGTIRVSAGQNTVVFADRVVRMSMVEDNSIAQDSVTASFDGGGDVVVRVRGTVSFQAIAQAISGLGFVAVANFSGDGLYVQELDSEPTVISLAGGAEAGVVYSFRPDTQQFGWTSTRVASPSLQAGGRFGETGTMDAAGNQVLLGGRDEFGRTGAAYLFDDSFVFTGLELRPYILFQPNSGPSVMVDDPTDNQGFGVGASIVSDRHYVLARKPTDANLKETLFNFRGRGPAWTALAAHDTVTPAIVPTAKVGTSVAIDGQTAVIGARDFDGRGAAFVYTMVPGTDDWVLQATLQAEGIQVDSHFGQTVAINGNTIVVGAPGVDSGLGAAYVFQRLGTAWSEVQALDRGSMSGFGRALDLGVSSLIVGASNSAAIYELGGSGWTLATRLNGSDDFGAAVAIDGGTALVGAPRADSQDGAVYVFADNGADWVQQGAPLTAADGADHDLFGRSLDLVGPYALIGAPGVASSSGAAYVFERSGGNWSQLDKLTVGGGQANDRFGFSVAMTGERAVIGAYGRDNSEGAAYAFGWKDGRLRLETVSEAISGGDAQPGDQVGYSVAIDGQTAIVGAPQLEGRPGLAIDTAGKGYAYIRNMSPPVNVTVLERQQTLIDGASANSITGTVGGVATADLHFFDIREVTLTTGSSDDHITLAEPGLTALGLADFSIQTGAGDDRFTTRSTTLQPPASQSYLPTGDFGTSGDGDPVPPEAGYTELEGGFRFDGGDGVNTVATAGNGDWILESDVLSATPNDRVELTNVQRAELVGGDESNQIEVRGWTGTVALDGGAASDQLLVTLGSVAAVTVADSSGSGDQLTVLGTDSDDMFSITLDAVRLDAKSLQYSGIERLLISGQDGDDRLSVVDTAAANLFLDGSNGSDEYVVREGTTSAMIRISDSGPEPSDMGGIDSLKVPDGVIPTVNQVFSVGPKRVLYDETIEEFGFANLNPILTLPGTVNPDYIVLDGATLTINGTPLDVADVQELTINALSGDDTFVVISVLPTMRKVDFRGDEGNDLVIGANSANQWMLTGGNAGSVTGDHPFLFSTIENLSGGSAADRFVLADGNARIQGNLRGQGGIDTLDYSSVTGPVTVALDDTTSSQIGGQLSGVEQFVGTAASDTLIGPNAVNAWNITANNAGSIGGLIDFASFEHLTGGAQSDTFRLPAGLTISGRIDGGLGADQLRLTGTESGDQFSVAAALVTRGGTATAYGSIESLQVETLGGDDTVTVQLAPTATDFPTALVVNLGDGADQIVVHLATGASSLIQVDGGDSALDSITVHGTADNDDIAMSGSQIASGGTTIALSGIEHATVAGGDGNDRLSLSGNGPSGNVALWGEGDDDTVTLNYPLSAGSLQVLGGNGSGDLLTVNTTDADDLLTLTAASLTVTGQTPAAFDQFEMLHVNTFGGADEVQVDGTPAGATQLDTGEGNDRVRIHSTGGDLSIETRLGADTVDVRAISATASIHLGSDSDNDTVNVSSDSPTNLGTLSGIAGLLSVSGTAGGNDVLNVSNAGDSSSRTGTLTASLLTGLGMSDGIAYGSLQQLQVSLGGGGNELIVEGTHAGQTLIEAGAGNDLVAVRSIGGPTNVDAQAGDDTVHVGSLAPTAGGTLNGILGTLVIDGNLGTDSLRLDDAGDTSDNQGQLTGTHLSGLGTSAGVDYARFEQISIDLGSGGDTFTIVTTHGGATHLNTGGGNDSLLVLDTAGPTSIDGGGDADTISVRAIRAATTVRGGDGPDAIHVGSLAPAGGGNVHAILAPLTVHGDLGDDTLHVDDQGDAAPNTGTLSATTLTGLGLGGGISYDSLEQLNITLGDGGNTFTIDGTHAGQTLVLTGAGADTVGVRATGGPTTIESQAGDDLLHLGSLAPAAGGTLNAIQGLVSLLAGPGTDRLHLDDSGDPLAGVGSLTATHIGGLGLGQGVDYADVELLELRLGGGGNELTVLATHAGQTLIEAGTGNDLVAVQSIGGPTSVDAQAGDDTVHVGSLAPAAGGTLNGILGTLVIDGNLGTDSLRLDDAGDTSDNQGQLTGTHLSGLGTSAGVDYARFEQFSIDLGSGGDTFTIATTHGGATQVNAGGGNDGLLVLDTAGPTSVDGGGDADTISVRAIRAATTVRGGDGPDAIHVGSLAPAGGGNVHGIAATLTVHGDLGDDTLHVDDQGDAAPNTGTLSATTLTGLGLGGGISYDSLEQLSITLGDGGNSFVIDGTHAGQTLVLTGAGADTVGVRATGGPTTIESQAGDDLLHLGSLAPAAGGTLNAIQGLVSLLAGSGTDRLLVDDSQDTEASVGQLTESRLLGLGTGAGVDYAGFEHLAVDLGVAGDTLAIDMSAGGSSLIDAVINGGAGDDQLRLESYVTGLSVITLNGNAGSDTFNQPTAPANPLPNTEPRGKLEPSLTTTIIVNGEAGPTGSGNPTTPPNGDTDRLNLDLTVLGGLLIIDTLTGAINQSSEYRPLHFSGMEDLCLDDTGGDDIQLNVGELYVRTTGARERITYTLANNGGLKLRVDDLDGRTSTAFPQTFGLIGGRQVLRRIVTYAGAGDDVLSVASHVVDSDNRPIPVTFHGGEGNDYLTGANGDDILVGGPGNDRVLGGEGDNRLFGDNHALDEHGIAIETPGDGDDYLSGRDGHDVMFGGGGADRLYGLGGNDYLHAGSGDDIADGGLGDDVLIGAEGRDNLNGSYGNDILLGGAGRDDLFGGHDQDLLLGGLDADYLRGGSGNDLLVGGTAGNVRDTTQDVALRAILAEWVSGNPAVPLGLGALELDGVEDLLIGDLGADLYHADEEDRVTD
ncbi:MAG: hypothetical protein J5I93_29520 [Pirellulaceae bacterium]|nr:hypothetical protein [Pirellulaceae bacterium]